MRKIFLVILSLTSLVSFGQLRKDQLNAINARDIKSSGGYSSLKMGKLIDSLILSLESQKRAAGYIPVGNGSGISVDVPLSGDATLSSSGALTLASVVSAGSCTLCNITYDAKGRITVANNGSAGTVTSVASADGSITVTNPTSTVDLAVVKAPIWSTARLLAGNSVNGSANVAFSNKFIVQGTTDTGLSGAQFMGALGTGLVKNTTTTGVLSIAVSGTDYQAPGNYITALTGDISASGPGSVAATLATVNSNVGTFGSATQTGTFTVNGKGLITAASNVTITPAIGSITGLGTNVATFLATPSSANEAAALTDETGTGADVFAGSPAFTGTPTLGTLGYSDTGILWSMQSSTNSYNQLVLQNTSNGASASTNLVISSDNGTSTTHFLEVGKNSSGFTGSGSFNLANASYLDDASDDLVIGTLANKTLHFVTNGATTDNLSITGAGAMTFNGTSTAIHKEIFTSLGTTQTDGAGLWLQNSTAAANAAQQRSPSLVMEGQGWATGGSTSQSVKFVQDVLPVQGTNAAAQWILRSSLNGGTMTNVLSATWDGSSTSINIGAAGSAFIGNNGANFTFQTTAGTEKIRFAGSSISMNNSSVNAMLNITQPAATSAWIPVTRYDPGAHTALTANTEFPDYTFSAANHTWVDGTVATQRWAYMHSPSVLGTTTLATVTDGFTLYIEKPLAGTKGAVTNPYALGLDGNLKLVTAKNKIFITEGTDGSVGQATLVSGTKAVTVNGTTTSTRCFATLVSQGGTVTTTIAYTCACTANTITITAVDATKATVTTDTSIVNYWVVN